MKKKILAMVSVFALLLALLAGTSLAAGGNGSGGGKGGGGGTGDGSGGGVSPLEVASVQVDGVDLEGATVSGSGTVVITFSRGMTDNVAANSEKITLSGPNGAVAVEAVAGSEKHEMDLVVSDLPAGDYILTIGADIMANNGNTLGTDYVVRFTAAGSDSGSSAVSERFTDVASDAWYCASVQWAVDEGIVNGVDEDTFDPDGAATRAMVVTMLWRLAGEPAAAGSDFADVTGDAWYAGAVGWAASGGVVNGMSANTFAPDAEVTREQLAAILYRYAQTQGEGFTGAWAFPLNYSDAAEVSDWAYEPLCWMTMNGVIQGMDGGVLAPGANATRAQITAMFMRFTEAIAK